MLVESMREKAEVCELLKGMETAGADLLKDWGTVLSARGLHESEAMKEKAELCNRLSRSVSELQRDLALVRNLEGYQARSFADEVLAELLKIRAAANPVHTAIEAERAKVRLNLEDLRRFRKK